MLKASPDKDKVVFQSITCLAHNGYFKENFMPEIMGVFTSRNICFQHSLLIFAWLSEKCVLHIDFKLSLFIFMEEKGLNDR